MMQDSPKTTAGNSCKQYCADVLSGILSRIRNIYFRFVRQSIQMRRSYRCDDIPAPQRAARGTVEASRAHIFPFWNRVYRRGDQPLSLKWLREPRERTIRAQPTRDGDDDVFAPLSLAGREMDLPPDFTLKAKAITSAAVHAVISSSHYRSHFRAYKFSMRTVSRRAWHPHRIATHFSSTERKMFLFRLMPMQNKHIYRHNGDSFRLQSMAMMSDELPVIQFSIGNRLGWQIEKWHFL